jgi:hypothetical protein
MNAAEGQLNAVRRQMDAKRGQMNAPDRQFDPAQRKSGGGPPHSKTLARSTGVWQTRSVLECASPLRFERRKCDGQEFPS